MNFFNKIKSYFHGDKVEFIILALVAVIISFVLMSFDINPMSKDFFSGSQGSLNNDYIISARDESEKGESLSIIPLSCNAYENVDDGISVFLNKIKNQMIMLSKLYYSNDCQNDPSQEMCAYVLENLNDHLLTYATYQTERTRLIEYEKSQAGCGLSYNSSKIYDSENISYTDIARTAVNTALSTLAPASASSTTTPRRRIILMKPKENITDLVKIIDTSITNNLKTAMNNGRYSNSSIGQNTTGSLKNFLNKCPSCINSEDFSNEIDVTLKPLPFFFVNDNNKSDSVVLDNIYSIKSLTNLPSVQDFSNDWPIFRSDVSTDYAFEETKYNLSNILDQVKTVQCIIDEDIYSDCDFYLAKAPEYKNLAKRFDLGDLLSFKLNRVLAFIPGEGDGLGLSQPPQLPPPPITSINTSPTGASSEGPIPPTEYNSTDNTATVYLKELKDARECIPKNIEYEEKVKEVESAYLRILEQMGHNLKREILFELKMNNKLGSADDTIKSYAPIFLHYPSSPQGLLEVGAPGLGSQRHTKITYTTVVNGPVYQKIKNEQILEIDDSIIDAAARRFFKMDLGSSYSDTIDELNTKLDALHVKYCSNNDSGTNEDSGTTYGPYDPRDRGGDFPRNIDPEKLEKITESIDSKFKRAEEAMEEIRRRANVSLNCPHMIQVTLQEFKDKIAEDNEKENSLLQRGITWRALTVGEFNKISDPISLINLTDVEESEKNKKIREYLKTQGINLDDISDNVNDYPDLDSYYRRYNYWALSGISEPGHQFYNFFTPGNGYLDPENKLNGFCVAEKNLNEISKPSEPRLRSLAEQMRTKESPTSIRRGDFTDDQIRL